MEIDQDNLRMKFSAFNIDFSSPSPDPLDSTRIIVYVAVTRYVSIAQTSCRFSEQRRPDAKLQLRKNILCSPSSFSVNH